MPTTITATADAETKLPGRPDGSPWPLLLIHGDRVTGADTAGELLAVLIPGYERIPDDAAGDDGALWRRYESAVATAAELQETLLAAAASRGDFDAGRADEEALTALLADNSSPCSRVDWRHPVSLVLIDTDLRAVHATSATRRRGHLPAASPGTRLPGVPGRSEADPVPRVSEGT